MSGQRALALPDWCSHAVEVGWLAAAVAVPLTFNPWGGSAFELPKAALLRALVLLMGLAALVRTIEGWGTSDRPPRRWLASPLLWAAVALGLALTLATVLSVNPRISLWGSYERQQGLLTVGAYLGLFVLTATGMRSRAQADRLWLALVWGSAPIVAYGLLQSTGIDPLGWQTDAASRVLSTVGRSNFLGSYLVLIIPLTVGRSLLSDRRWPYLAFVTVQALCLALTQARGAWVGLAAGMMVFGLAWATVTRNRSVWIAVVVGGALAAGAVVMLNLSLGPLTALADLPGLDRVATLTRTDEGSTAARLTIWRAAAPLLADRTLLGYGPETMRTVFARVFPPQLVYYQGRNVNVDRAHNLWLDLGMGAGLVGILAFAAFLAIFGWVVWRGLRSAPDRWEQVAWVAVTAGVVGHLVDLQFGFDLTASATVMWLMLALAAALGRGLSLHEAERAAASARTSRLPYLPLAAACFVGVLGFGVLPLLADVDHWRAWQEPISQHALESELRAARLQPQVLEYRLGLSRLYLGQSQVGAGPVHWLGAAETELAAADQLSPRDYEVWAEFGRLYTFWGGLDPTRYPDAEYSYRLATELAPNHANLYVSWGMLYAQQGRYGEAIEKLEEAVALDATYGYAFWHLGEAYTILGLDEGAENAYCQAFHWAPELRTEEVREWLECRTLNGW
jgi:O-antigen ligase